MLTFRGVYVPPKPLLNIMFHVHLPGCTAGSHISSRHRGCSFTKGSEGETLRPVDGRVLQPGCFYEDRAEPFDPPPARETPGKWEAGGWAILVVKNGDFVRDFARIWGYFWGDLLLDSPSITNRYHEKINPKNWQVSLGDAVGFSVFFGVVSSDYYGKPRALPTPVGSPQEWLEFFSLWRSPSCAEASNCLVSCVPWFQASKGTMEKKLRFFQYWPGQQIFFHESLSD